MIELTRPSCPNPAALQTDYKNPENKRALIIASFGKCMYCESFVTATYFGDVEHIKPKAIFPQLEFVWENHGFSCAVCNNNKRDKYSATCEYINPYRENPADFLLAAHSVFLALRGSERGEKTILDLGLNRKELVQRRHEKLAQIDKAIKNCFKTQDAELRTNALNELLAEAGDSKEYSMSVKSLLTSHGLENG